MGGQKNVGASASPSGSRPTGQAPAGLDASRFDPLRKKNNRACGARFELECVHDAQARRLKARKHFLSGSADEKGDITITAAWGDEWPGECKWKKALPQWLISALGNHKFVAFKQSRGEKYALIRWDDFLGLLQ